jgi:hypothetical protein
MYGLSDESPGRPAATSFAVTLGGPSSNNSMKSLTHGLTAVTGTLMCSTHGPPQVGCSTWFDYVNHSAGPQKRTHPAMQCFFDTTEGGVLNTTFGVAEKWPDYENSLTETKQRCPV